ncbi:MAG: hypothetical protein IPJ11_12450 [Gemmatimonadetes bacterium]|nr:hypothetical protein [Gemmatimonadota bacterium]
MSIRRLQLVLVALINACGTAQVDRRLSDTVAFDVASSAERAVPLDETMHPSLTLGGLQANPDDEFASVAGLVSLGDGRLVLVEEHRVRMFDSSGVERWRYGQAGSGPGDFRMLGAPCHFHGDTLVAMDVGNARLAYIVVGVGVIATVPVEQERMRDGACSGNGAVLLTRSVRDSAPGTWTDEVIRRGAPMEPARTVHRAPALGREVVGAGPLMVGFSDTLIFVGDPNRGEILLLTAEGKFHRLLQWAGPRLEVTDANIPAHYGRAPRGATPEQLERYWAEVRARPRAAHWPAFADVAAASHGHIWLWPTIAAGAEEGSTTVLSLEGAVTGRIALPLPSAARRVFVLALLPEGVAMMHTDADGAERISVVPYPQALK